MPRVPTYDGQQVQTRALPGARLNYTPANPGAAINTGLQQFGRGVTDLWLTEQKRQSEIAVLEADRKLSSWTINTLHNPETGALNRKGKDAFGLPDEVMPAFEKIVEETEKGLSNTAQRDAFRKLVSGRRNEIDQTLLRHVSSEMRRFEDQELDAYVKNAHDAALANPDGAGNEIERQRLAITSYAARNGLGPEWQKLKFGEAQSKTHLGVIDGMLARGEDLKAAVYYANAAGALLGADKTRAEKALEVGTLRGESQRQADRITTQYNDPAAMIAAVEEIKDPKLRDATEERVQRKIRFLDEVTERNSDAAFTQAWTIVQQTGDLDKVSPSVWAGLRPRDQRSLEQYAKRIASGDDTPNNNEKYLAFLNIPERKLPQLTEAELLSDYLPHFDKAHREKAMTRWANARDAANGNKTAEGKHATTQNFNDVVASTLVKADIGLELGYSKTDLKELPEEKQHAIVDFVDSADRAIKQYERTQLGGKRAATSEEMQKIVDGLLIQKVFVENQIFPGGEERPAVLLTESERKRAKWPEAPTDPTQRTAGQTYNTPKGPLQWTGTGWRKN